jgi:hypothetical protein
MLVSASIPNLINGVSQQPVSLRMESQSERQENALSSVVDGLMMRPPVQHVKNLPSPLADNAFTHTINRDRYEQYIVAISGGSLRVFDLDGNEKTVNAPNGTGYLAASDPKTSFRAVTVADYTFIVNTGIVCQMSSARSAARPYEALVAIENSSYGRTYEIAVSADSGVSASATFTTPDGSTASHATQADTGYITAQLVAALNSDLQGSGLGATQYGNVIYLSSSSTDFTVYLKDPMGGRAMGLVKGTVPKFSDLPPTAPDGVVVRVVGSDGNRADDYYLSFDARDGVWKETLAPNAQYQFNLATMPHVLVREANGTFTFRQASWLDREVGDDDSAPFPSFIGRTISDVFFYRNRLGFLADEGVVFSGAGDFFNFWPRTATTLLDDGPIDVSVSHVKVSLLRHAIPHSERLLLFSEQTQFIIRPEDDLTPSSISINQTTEFDCSRYCRPVGAGRSVFFAADRGNWTTVQEYFTSETTEADDASDVTAHVPKYVPAGVYKLVSSKGSNMIVALTAADPSALYVYAYYWSGNEKLQSAWSRWTLDGATILNAEFFDTALYLVVQRNGATAIERIDLDLTKKIGGASFPARLDRQVFFPDHPDVGAVSDASWLTLTLPYDIPEGFVVVATAPNTLFPEGYIIPHEVTGTRTIRFPVDKHGWAFVMGVPFEFVYEFSKQRMREGSAPNAPSIEQGRLQLRYFTVRYENTGYFEVDVEPAFRETYRYTFSGRVTGSGSNKLGEVALEDGTFRFPVQCRADDVTITLRSKSFLPCSFQNAEWEGKFTLRNRRV